LNFFHRSPFGLFYHAAWFTQPHHKIGFETFLDTLVSMEDVWIVTSWQAIQYLRSLPDKIDPKKFGAFQCHKKVEMKLMLQFIFLIIFIFSIKFRKLENTARIQRFAICGTSLEFDTCELVRFENSQRFCDAENNVPKN